MSETSGTILVVKLSGLVGFVQCLPAMKAIREHHRGAPILLLTDPSLETLAADIPYFDEVEAVENLSEPGVLARTAQRLKKLKFSRVYDLESSDLSERLYGAMKPFPPVWSGHARGAKFRYTPAADANKTEAALAQVKQAGIDVDLEAFPEAEWAATARHGAPSLKPAFFGLKKPYVLIAPVVRRDGEPPHWPSARFAGLAARLNAHGVDVAVVAEPIDKAGARATLQACPEAKDLASRADFTQIAALAREAAAAIGHADTGVVHLAAAAGAPTISIASSHERAQRNGPKGPGVITLATADPAELSVEYAASTLAMFAGIGQLKAAAGQ